MNSSTKTWVAAVAALTSSACSSTTFESAFAERPSSDVAVEILVTGRGDTLVQLQSRFSGVGAPWRVDIESDVDVYYVGLSASTLQAIDRRVDLSMLSGGSVRVFSETCANGRFDAASVEFPLDASTDVFQLEGTRFVEVSGMFPFRETIAVTVPLTPIECEPRGMPAVVPFSDAPVPLPSGQALRGGAMLDSELFLGFSGKRAVTALRGATPLVHDFASRDPINDPNFLIRDLLDDESAPGGFIMAASNGPQGYLAYGTATSTSVRIDELHLLRGTIVRLARSDDGNFWGAGDNYVMRSKRGAPIEEREFSQGLPFRSIAQAPFGEMVIGGGSGTAAIGDPFGNLDLVVLGDEGLHADSSIVHVLSVPPDHAFLLSSQRGAFRVNVDRHFEKYRIHGPSDVLRCGGIEDGCGRALVSESSPRPTLSPDGDLIIPSRDCTKVLLHQFATGCTSIVDRDGIEFGLDTELGIQGSVFSRGTVILLGIDRILEFVQ